MKVGIKLWSTNINYLNIIKKLYKEGLFDYIELLSVPKSFEETIEEWKKINCEYIIHCPHYQFNFNLSDRNLREENKKKFLEVHKFADVLNSKFIIMHSGVAGALEEVVFQIKEFKDTRIVIENKPIVALNNKRCLGSTIEEIKRIKEEAKVEFCLDIGHCFYSAFKLNIDPYKNLKEYQALHPIIYHIGDGYLKSEKDKHLNCGAGDFDFTKIFDIINLKKEYITIETPKDFNNNLEDYKKDYYYLKRYMK